MAMIKTGSSADKAVKGNVSSLIVPINTVSPDFPIVGIGASAGGLEVLEQFFKAMPINSNMAFVIIQHLDPTHVGMMPELLQRLTPMKVSQAADGLHVKPNCVYVIPPNKSLSLLNGALHLFDPIETRGLRLPVDIFFKSLAEDKKEKSIGIVLSGMGSDGSLGLKAIKEKNGLVMVQDPETAKFNGMPRSAVESVTADIVAPVEELPAKLIQLLKFLPAEKTETTIDAKNSNSLDKIILLLRDQSGHDFSFYKKNTLIRRIERRKSVHQIDNIANYVRLLQENPKELEILFKELLIGVTSFFRDAEVWEKLRDPIMPELIKSLPDGTVLRAWVVGCSTGEEAFSLAIIFKEVMESMMGTRKLSMLLFATDLDKDAIEKARKAIYPANITADVSTERLNRYFTLEQEGYRVNTAIREMVVFAHQNITKDPPFTKLDLLSCRNMLIYMEPILQKRIFGLFNYSLNPGGILLLGSAETIGNTQDGFEVVDGPLKFFRRTKTSATAQMLDLPNSVAATTNATKPTAIAPKAVENIQTLTDQLLLQRFAPASILVNENGDILYLTARATKYLEPVAGKTNWNIHAMARAGLQQALPSAFRKAKTSYEPLELTNIEISSSEGPRMADITIQKIDSPNTLKDCIIVVLTELPLEVNAIELHNKMPAPHPPNDVNELELSLQRSAEELQHLREEMQTSQEELKSTNEELQSTNEELQSTNEELTTSKEEMQSLNEELQTVNSELQSRITDFEQANNDMENLLNSTEIATLFLDKTLNIRKFTDSVSSIIKLRKLDIGRPLNEIVTDLEYPHMSDHAQQVLKDLLPTESTNTTQDGRWYKIRIMPYRTLDDKVDGLVITFANITEEKKLGLNLQEANEVLQASKQKLMASETSYRRLFESAKDGILILNADNGKITDVNPFLIDLLGYSKKEFVEKAIWEIGFFKDVVANQEKFAELQQKEIVRYDNLPLETENGKKINVEFVSNVYEAGGLKVIQCNIRDITERKRSEALLKVSENRYRRIFESAKDGILLLNAANGKIMDVNPYLIEMMGYSKEVFLEKAIWEIGFFKDIVANQEKFEELQQKEIIRYEDLPLETAGGRKINVEFSSNVYEENNIKIIQCIIRNITERKLVSESMKENEIKFKALFENSPVGIAYQKMIYDKEGKPIDYFILDANKMFQQLTGVDPRGKTATQNFPNISKDPFDWMGTFGKVARTGQTVQVEQYFQPNDRWYNCVAYQYQPDYFVTTFIEITAQKKAEAALQKYNQKQDFQ